MEVKQKKRKTKRKTVTLPLPFCNTVCTLCTLGNSSLTTIVHCLCCSQWWVLVWKGECFLTNGLWPTTWQWWMALLALAAVLGLSLCSRRIGGAKLSWAILKHVLSQQSLCSPYGFFTAQQDWMCVWCARQTWQQARLSPHDWKQNCCAASAEGQLIIIRAQSKLWCQMWPIKVLHHITCKCVRIDKTRGALYIWEENRGGGRKVGCISVPRSFPARGRESLFSIAKESRCG